MIMRPMSGQWQSMLLLLLFSALSFSFGSGFSKSCTPMWPEAGVKRAWSGGPAQLEAVGTAPSFVEEFQAKTHRKPRKNPISVVKNMGGVLQLFLHRLTESSACDFHGQRSAGSIGTTVGCSPTNSHAFDYRTARSFQAKTKSQPIIPNILEFQKAIWNQNGLRINICMDKT